MNNSNNKASSLMPIKNGVKEKDSHSNVRLRASDATCIARKKRKKEKHEDNIQTSTRAKVGAL